MAKFAAEFISCIYEKQAGGKISHEVAVVRLLKVLATMVPAFTLGSAAEVPAKRRRIDESAEYKSGISGGARWHLESNRIVRLISHCLSMGLKDEMDQLITKLNQEAGKANAMALEQVFMPFLGSLPQVIQDHGLPLTTGNY